MISIIVQFMKFKRARESYMEAQTLDFKVCEIDTGGVTNVFIHDVFMLNIY